MDRNWKLNDDMYEDDNILDPTTFADIILTVQRNEKVVDRAAVRKVAKEIMAMRLEDYNFILNNNIDEIVKIVKERRNIK